MEPEIPSTLPSESRWEEMLRGEKGILYVRVCKVGRMDFENQFKWTSIEFSKKKARKWKKGQSKSFLLFLLWKPKSGQKQFLIHFDKQSLY